MKTVFIAALLALMALVSGCASIVSGSNQSISVEARSEGATVKNATCKLTNDKGTWFTDTPGSVTVHRSYDDLAVRCEKDNYEPGIATVKSSTKPMMFGNILFGGIIGGAVDAGTGAGYDYPALVTVIMGTSTTIRAPDAPQGRGAAEVSGAQTTTALVNSSGMQRGVSSESRGGTPGGVVAGAVWTYQFTEQLSPGRTTKVSVRADRVDGDVIEESVFQPGETATVERRTINARETRFLRYGLGKEEELVEFAPYLMVPANGKAAGNVVTPIGYFDARNGWQVDGHREGVEVVSVPAGTFRAVRYQISAERTDPLAPYERQTSVMNRYQVDVWYAAEVGRIIKLQHRTWTMGRPLTSDVVELVEYRATH